MKDFWHMCSILGCKTWMLNSFFGQHKKGITQSRQAHKALGLKFDNLKQAAVEVVKILRQSQQEIKVEEKE